MHRVTNKIVSYSPTNHCAVLGWSGTGKGVQAEAIFCQFKGKKFDLFSLDRFEGLYYGLPQDSEEFIERGKLYTNGTFKPEAIPHKIYFIAGKLLKNYDWLPANIEVVSFREKDLDANDYIALVGTTDGAESLMHDIIEYLTEEKQVKVNFKNILALLKEFSVESKYRDEEIHFRFSSPHPQTLRVMKNNINILKASGIFDTKYKHLDIAQMYECEEAITISPTMCETVLERGIASSLALKKVVEYQKKKADKQPVLIYWRELQYNFDDELKGHFKLANDNLHYVLTQGRDNNLWLLADWQITNAVPSNFLSHFRQIFSLAQPPAGVEKLTGLCYIDQQTIQKLPSLERFQGIWICNGKYEYPCEVIPPICKKKRDGEDVLGVLGGIFGKKPILSIVQEEETQDTIYTKENFTHKKNNLTRTRNTINVEKSDTINYVDPLTSG